MVFTSPFMLFGFLALPVLAAVYWLRRRSQEVVVSSLAFWIDPRAPRQGGRRLDRMQTPLTFLLELLAIMLLVLAAAGPALVKREVVRTLMVVLDDSYSMQATAGGPDAERARDRAVAALMEELRRNNYVTRFVVAGAQPRVLGRAVGEPAQAGDLLRAWTCQSPTADVPAAMGLAAELGGPAARILVLTDQPPESELSSGQTEWWGFGQRRSNVAFTTATRTPGAEGQRVLLEVTNFSTSAATTTLALEGGEFATAADSRLELAAGATKRLFFDLPDRSPLLRATLPPDDLALDNEVLLLPVAAKPVRVQVDVGDEPLRRAVEKALEATGQTLRVTARPELLISDQPGPAITDAWRMTVLGGERAEAYTGPFVIDHGHVLTQGLSLQNAIWSASPTSDPDGLAIITAGNVPLLTEIEDSSGRHRLQMPFVAEMSTLQDTPDWPILFANLIQWRRSGLPGIAAPNVRLGQNVTVSLRGTPDRVKIVAPGETSREITVGGRRVVFPVEQVGLHAVKSDHEQYRFACNTVRGDESNLANCRPGHWGSWNDSQTYQDRRAGLGWIFLVMAMAVMVGHQLVVARNTGGDHV